MFDLTAIEYVPSKLYQNPLVEITQSAIDTFQTCHQKFVFRYMMRIAPQETAIPLLVGRAIHACFEYILAPNLKNKKQDVALQNWCRATIDKIFDDANLNSGSTNVQKLEHGRAQAVACVEAWQIINCDYDQQFKVIQTEKNIRAKDKATANSPWKDRMAGKIDGLVIDLATNGLWLLEHKSRYSLYNLDFVNGLSLDGQSLFYALLYQEWLTDSDSPLKSLAKNKLAKTVDLRLPSGLYYDVVAKPQHRKGDTFDELKQRMVQAMLENPEKYFYLAPIEISPLIIERARSNFGKVINQMDNLSPANVTQNLKACNMYGGCPYRQLCGSGANAEKPEEVLRNDYINLYRYAGLHEELESLDEE